MVTTQDASIGYAIETTYRTPVTASRWVEFYEESLNWTPNRKQGMGLRVGGRVARSARRVTTTADGSGGFSVEATSKGLGTLLQAALGAATSTLVSGTTYQQVFTLGDVPPSLTIQKGMPQAGSSTIDAYTYSGCMVDTLEIDFPNADYVSFKPSFDMGDLSTTVAYAAPSYPVTPSLYQFANGSIFGGTLTAPTATTLASATAPIGDVRGGSVTINNNLTKDRQNLGNGGRKAKPTVGLRDVNGSLTVEYDTNTWRDAFLTDAPTPLLLNFVGGPLSTGVETLQVVLPEYKIDSPLANVNGADLVTTDLAFTVLDNLTAAQPVWIILRTSDTAL